MLSKDFSQTRSNILNTHFYRDESTTYQLNQS